MPFLPWPVPAPNPATTLTFLDLYGDKLDIELGTIDRTERFTTALRQLALNEAQTEFIERTECLVEEFSVAMLDGDAEIDLETQVTNYLRMAKTGPSIKIVDAAANARYIEGPDDFPQKDPPLRNRHTPGWRANPAGTPVGWYLRRVLGSLTFGVTPAPDIPATETWTLLVPCVVRAVDMVNDNDAPFTVAGGVSPGSLVPWHQALVHQATYTLEKLRKDTLRMKIQADLFESYVQRYRRQDYPKGGQRIQLAHDYRRRSRGRGFRRMSVRAESAT